MTRGVEKMRNRYVNVKCPICNSSIQMKAASVRSEFFFCPVCEYGEIENPGADLIIHCHKVRKPGALKTAVAF